MQFPESLKVFCDVARYRSFSQAARANGLSQSAVSQIVLALEKRLDVQLIDRSTRPPQLTPVGRTYYEGCKEILERYLELEGAIRRQQAQLDVSVEVAAIYSVGLGDMGHYVECFVGRDPSAKVHIEYLHPDRVYEKVLDGTVDFGLVSFPRRSRELMVLPWREEPMVLACPPEHPLAGQQAVKPSQFEGEKYVGFDKELVIRREVDRFLRDQGVTVNVVLEFDSIENIKKAVEIAAGVALLPEPTVRGEVQAGTLAARPLAGCRFVRPVGVIRARQHKLSPAAERFLALLREPAPDGPAGGVPGAFACGNGPQARTNGTHHPAHAGMARVSKRKS